MNSILRGAWSGVMATSSMTMALFKGHKELPRREQSPLPPAILTDDIQRRLGVFPNARSEIKEQATLFSHFGYGALGGVAYALLADKVPVKSPVVKGTLFGLSVWAISYYGLIPALNLRPKGEHMTSKRNLMMIAAHVVWGTSLAYAEKELHERDAKLLDGKRNRQLLH